MEQGPSIGEHVLDKQDYKIIDLMTQDADNKTIAEKLCIPLSTIQRRSRILLRKGYVKHMFQPKYHKLGLKNGLLHIYIKNGNMRKTAEELLSSDGVMSAGIHVGNSDVVGEFVYQDSEQVVDLISRANAIDGVDSVVWSEEVYLLAGKKQSILSVLKRIIDRK